MKFHFKVGDRVLKHTGDYHASGVIVAVFDMYRGLKCIVEGTPLDPVVRYVVRHEAEGGGYFCHIYSEKNLKFIEEQAHD